MKGKFLILVLFFNYTITIFAFDSVLTDGSDFVYQDWKYVKGNLNECSVRMFDTDEMVKSVSLNGIMIRKFDIIKKEYLFLSDIVVILTASGVFFYDVSGDPVLISHFRAKDDEVFNSFDVIDDMEKIIVYGEDDLYVFRFTDGKIIFIFHDLMKDLIYKRVNFVQGTVSFFTSSNRVIVVNLFTGETLIDHKVLESNAIPEKLVIDEKNDTIIVRGIYNGIFRIFLLSIREKDFFFEKSLASDYLRDFLLLSNQLVISDFHGFYQYDIVSQDETFRYTLKNEFLWYKINDDVIIIHANYENSLTVVTLQKTVKDKEIEITLLNTTKIPLLESKYLKTFLNEESLITFCSDKYYITDFESKTKIINFKDIIEGFNCKSKCDDIVITKVIEDLFFLTHSNSVFLINLGENIGNNLYNDKKISAFIWLIKDNLIKMLYVSNKSLFRMDVNIENQQIQDGEIMNKDNVYRNLKNYKLVRFLSIMKYRIPTYVRNFSIGYINETFINHSKMVNNVLLVNALIVRNNYKIFISRFYNYYADRFMN